MTCETESLRLDVRGRPCAERRASIFAAFDRLLPGEAIEIVNDHAPNGLRGHFDELRPGLYGWEPQVDGPEAWQVRISRL